MKRIKPFWRSTLASCCIGRWDIPYPHVFVGQAFQPDVRLESLTYALARSKHKWRPEASAIVAAWPRRTKPVDKDGGFPVPQRHRRVVRARPAWTWEMRQTGQAVEWWERRVDRERHESEVLCPPWPPT